MQDSFKIGDYVEIEKSFSIEDVRLFSELSFDTNPLHLDSEFAAKSIFGKRIVHGILVSSLFSGLIANKLPGNGSIYLHQSLNFKAPVFHDTKVIARVQIENIREDKPIYELSTICMESESGKILIEGKAIVLLNKN